MGTYNKKIRKSELVQSKSGKWYYRNLKRDKCIDCETDISVGYSRCHTCRGKQDRGINWYKHRNKVMVIKTEGKEVIVVENTKDDDIIIDPKWLSR